MRDGSTASTEGAEVTLSSSGSRGDAAVELSATVDVPTLEPKPESQPPPPATRHTPPRDAPRRPLDSIFSEGYRFGAYVVGPCIGHGGMARIYRAEHEGLQRQVALKVLTEGVAKDAEGRQRFLREARNAAAIKHPNVVNIFDVGVHQGTPYLVMELLEGQDLESLIVSKGALDEGMIIDLIVPVVAGLAAVHDAGIVHRDLKPGNIFLARGRNDEVEPKVLDFGISKALGVDHLKLTSASGLLLGTPSYLSPEAVHGKEVTPLSDQYSLGVVMYECATGVNPFEAQSFAEVFRLITSAECPPPSKHKPELSARLTRIIQRAMSLEPEKRFASIRELGRELLLLAGQRTRVTWALSFGVDFSDGANISPVLGATSPATLAALPEISAGGPRQRKRRTLAVLTGVAAVSGVVSFLVASGTPGNGGSSNGATATSSAGNDGNPRSAISQNRPGLGDSLTDPGSDYATSEAASEAASETDAARTPGIDTTDGAGLKSSVSQRSASRNAVLVPSTTLAGAVRRNVAQPRKQATRGAASEDDDLFPNRVPLRRWEPAPEPTADLGTNGAPIPD